MANMNPNPKQRQAIEAGIDEDIVISAGAGSGKTKTLSTRVERLIESGDLLPSELLVLTFTNNAAHEMRDRIIRSFSSESDNAAKMLSSHIRTFDSFSSYLVTQNASALGIASAISIGNPFVLDSMRRSLLDELFLERYSDPANSAEFIEFLRKYNLANDEPTKIVILDLQKKISSLIPAKRARFYENYEEEFFSDEFINAFRKTMVQRVRDRIVTAIFDAYYLETHYDEITHPEKNEQRIASLSDASFFEKDYRAFSFVDEDYTQKAYAIYLDMLEKDDDAFLEEAIHFGEIHSDVFFSRKPKGFLDEPNDRYRAPFMEFFRCLFTTSDAAFSVEDLSSLLHLKETLLARKKDYAYLVGLVKELDERFLHQKKAMNIFDFNDVAMMALALLTEEKYKDIAESIRCRYRYIMVDEYQDTNDIQEAVLDSLTKTNHLGEKAHLFVVGDAKQSIYRFRGSNVSLFRKRQDEYSRSSDPKQKVIAMNINYRSGKKLLADMNYLFSFYMTRNHGSIDYLDEAEQLFYDDDVDLYCKPYDHFGVFRALTEKGSNAAESRLIEARAILADIQKKIKEGYLVYPKGQDPRPCRYSDFGILLRTKTAFSDYQKVFVEANIPLNNKLTTNLSDVNAVMALISLLRLVDSIQNGTVIDLPHVFLSLARSYLYRYPDNKIHEILCSSNVMEAMKEDPIYQDAKAFAFESKGWPLSVLFTVLLERFQVMEKLYSIGDVADNFAKIDSLYDIILSQEQAGEGLSDFLVLTSLISQYRLEMKEDTVYQSENGVDLMTIHASKGLERKIVYLPVSGNKLARGGNIKPDYDYLGEYGFALPNYDVPEDLHFSHSMTVYPHDYLPFDEEEEEIDEHVRLIYVAFTRAENAVIVVGNDDETKEGLYEVFNHCPHYIYIDEALLKKAVEEGALSQVDVKTYQNAVSACKKRFYPLAESLFPNHMVYRRYLEMVDHFYYQANQDIMEKSVTAIREALYLYYFVKAQSLAKANDPKLVRLYGLEYGLPNCEIKADLIKEIEALLAEEDLGEQTSAELADEWLKNFAEALVETTLDSDTLDLESAALPIRLGTLLQFFLGLDGQFRACYDTDDYEDKSYTIEVGEEAKPVRSIERLPESQIDDSEIAFQPHQIKRASKTILIDSEAPSAEILARGTYLHRLLQLTDLKTKDVSWIKEEKDREILAKVLSLPIFDELEDANVYREYTYYDEVLGTSGSIDLLLVKDGRYIIIDYKTSHIDDPAYLSQVQTYKANVMRLFGVGEEAVETYLLSLLSATCRKVD